jgi:prolyl oligopeptidase
MRWLCQEGYTKPARLAIMGGSNGGLLVGAAVTRTPFLFRAAIGSVGLYDMVRYHKFPPAELWIDEYGDPDRPEDLAFLRAYSPYHQVVDGVSYPACYLNAAENDTRVHWVHTAKFAARLQQANAGALPILFHLQRQEGHGAGKGKYREKYAFLFSQLGME